MKISYLVAAAMIVVVATGSVVTIFRGNPVPEEIIASLDGDPDREARYFTCIQKRGQQEHDHVIAARCMRFNVVLLYMYIHVP